MSLRLFHKRMEVTQIQSSQIKAEALRLGFDACGIAKAEPIRQEVAEEFREWLRQGHHASMQYMENHLEKRLNPQLLMEGVRSIVCVALNYKPSAQQNQEGYQLAAYALGRDYHDIVKEKLHQLAAYIIRQWGDEEQPVSYRAFTDSAPVMERYWAMQAGIGWIGRHHQLIIPKSGSMFFLGELFLNIPLAYDHPAMSHCGNCTRCIEACPTGALSAEGPFRAERCLSYLTIENREEIPPEMKDKMGSTIYGCDRCQQACPWNTMGAPTREPALQPKEELMTMTREQWQHLSEEDYRRLFKGSAVKRAKYSGLMRNIQAVASKESADQ
ncbi:MAG: tRNA epoxyqueuosine(34) reductase QueG [Prevotella sp.]|nr:tRNA epoxyqueuosine(34) reductase QueG [Prevotella sp.]